MELFRRRTERSKDNRIRFSAGCRTPPGSDGPTCTWTITFDSSVRRTQEHLVTRTYLINPTTGCMVKSISTGRRTSGLVAGGRQSGSTRSEAYDAVLPDHGHASSTRRRSRSLARWGVGTRPPDIGRSNCRGASRRRGAGRQPTCEHADLRRPEGARSDGSASTSCRVIRAVRVSLAGACRDQPSLKPAGSRCGCEGARERSVASRRANDGGRRPSTTAAADAAAVVTDRL